MTSLERDLEALFEAQVRSLDVGNPPTLGDVEAADRSSGVSVPRPAVMAGGDVVDVELGDRIVEPVVANRRHWWTTVTVAAAVSLVVSVLVVSFRDVGELQPAVTPPMTNPPMQVANPPLPDLVGVATAFWEALAAGDRAAALGYVGPGAVDAEPLSVFGRAATLEGQFDWYEAVGWQWALEDCMPGGVEGMVRCTVTGQNTWSEALAVDPVPGVFYLWFDDDGYLTSTTETFGSGWYPQVFRHFAAWVQQNHPDDAKVMWADTDVNAEILDLFEINTERFVAAQLAERSTTTLPAQEEQ
jgi:hypothetical protein